MIVLGQQVRCRVTGFTGIVIGRAEHLFDMPTIRIQPAGVRDDGWPKDAGWFAEAQFEPFGDQSGVERLSRQESSFGR